jgi:hypothetical protein
LSTCVFLTSSPHSLCKGHKLSRSLHR